MADLLGTMPAQDYLPNREDELAVWVANFIAKLVSYATTLGILPAELTAVTADGLLLQAIIDYAEAVKQDAKEVTAFKNIELYGSAGDPTPMVPAGATPIALSPRPPGIVPRLRALVARIKANANYTTAMGEDLGIVGSVTAASTTPKPTGSATVSGAHEVTIKFLKGIYDGVEIECRRAGETAFTLLAFDSYSPYVDNRPLLVPGQPEQREYRMRYRHKDGAVGDYSDVMTVAVSA